MLRKDYMMNVSEKALQLHREWKGKLSIVPKMSLDRKETLSLAYTPGVAAPCLAIQADPAQSFALTGRGNCVAVITDGSAVLGLGDIGPEAAMPVMEGKCALFKAFGGIDAFPLCIRSQDTEEIVKTISLLAGSFGGINLEDISAPRCFQIEARLKECCDIPVFHDDQHGTAIVTLAALQNALTLTHRRLEDVKIVISGAGAAGTAIAELLLAAGAKNLIVCDRKGALAPQRHDLNPAKKKLASLTNPNKESGSLADVLTNAHVFIGVSAPGLLTGDMIRAMAPSPIIFACANPEPEILPPAALAAGAAVAATGRSDFPNQVNNLLAFPGIFRGALDAKAKAITQEMCLAAASAIAHSIPPHQLTPDHIIPDATDLEVHKKVARAVCQTARETK